MRTRSRKLIPIQLFRITVGVENLVPFGLGIVPDYLAIEGNTSEILTYRCCNGNLSVLFRFGSRCRIDISVTSGIDTVSSSA